MTFFEDFAAAVSASRAVSTAAASHRPSAAPLAGNVADPYLPEIRLLSEAGSMSLGKLIIDSYIRNGVQVPTSLSQLLPKLQAVCPRVRYCQHHGIPSRPGIHLPSIHPTFLYL